MNKSTKMASFSSGIMLSRSEAQRQKGDELRMRAAGIDPTKIDEQWAGEVMSRRQKKEAKVDEEIEKEKRLAAELPMEKSDVVGKKPEGRLKWLHKALVLAAKGRIPAPQIYNIIQSSKFTSGVSSKVGLKMKGLVFANLHLFKKEQQKSLQQGRLMDFSADGGSSEEKKKKRRHSQSRSYSSSQRSCSRSHSRKKRKKERSEDAEQREEVKKKKKDKVKERAKEEKKEEKVSKKEEKAKKEKSHREEKKKEEKSDKKSKAAKEAAAKLAAAEEELASAQEEAPEEVESASAEEAFDERFPPQAATAGQLGTVKMKLSGWKPACLRM